MLLLEISVLDKRFLRPYVSLLSVSYRESMNKSDGLRLSTFNEISQCAFSFLYNPEKYRGLFQLSLNQLIIERLTRLLCSMWGTLQQGDYGLFSLSVKKMSFIVQSCLFWKEKEIFHIVLNLMIYNQKGE